MTFIGRNGTGTERVRSVRIRREIEKRWEGFGLTGTFASLGKDAVVTSTISL